MKRIGNHGSIGSQHQIQPNMGSNQILGSGQNLMSESYQQGGQSHLFSNKYTHSLNGKKYIFLKVVTVFF